MTTRFTLFSKGKPDTFKDNASINDVVEYEFDCTAWEQDNSTITGATITVESGSATISNNAVSSGVLTFLANFSQVGNALISILLTTAREQKKIWLHAKVKDPESEYTDDYGICS